jgi:hypothetical protein
LVPNVRFWPIVAGHLDLARLSGIDPKQSVGVRLETSFLDQQE